MSALNDSRGLDEEAHSIAAKNKKVSDVWYELKNWASDKGPMAMKVAVFKFLDRFSTSPEAAPIFPEILQQASLLSPSLVENERKTLIKLANSASIAARESLFKCQIAVMNPNTDCKTQLPISENRPAPLLFFKPGPNSKLSTIGSTFGTSGLFAPSASTNDLLRARDTICRVSEKLHERSIPIPQASSEEKKDNTSEITTEPIPEPLSELMSFSMPLDSSSIDSSDNVMSADKGEELIKSLLEKVKSHGREEKKEEGEGEPPKEEGEESVSEKEEEKGARPKKKKKKKPKKKKKKPMAKKAKKKVKKSKKINKN